MKTLMTAATLVTSLCLATIAHANTMESFEARIGLGLTPDNQGFPAFFTGGFTQGDTSHTNTLSFDDTIVQMDITLTIEAFDAGGSPAGLIVNNSATGVELGVVNNQIDPGEAVKFTVDNILFSVIGAHPMGPVDSSSFEALLSSIRLTAFDDGVDTYTYSGLAAGSVIGDDTDTIGFVPSAPLANGDMFTVTADTGAFRALFLSASGNYKVVPEPATFGLMGVALLGMATMRRKK